MTSATSATRHGAGGPIAARHATVAAPVAMAMALAAMAIRHAAAPAATAAPAAVAATTVMVRAPFLRVVRVVAPPLPPIRRPCVARRERWVAASSAPHCRPTTWTTVVRARVRRVARPAPTRAPAPTAIPRVVAHAAPRAAATEAIATISMGVAGGQPLARTTSQRAAALEAEAGASGMAAMAMSAMARLRGATWRRWRATSRARCRGRWARWSLRRVAPRKVGDRTGAAIPAGA